MKKTLFCVLAALAISGALAGLRQRGALYPTQGWRDAPNEAAPRRFNSQDSSVASVLTNAHATAHFDFSFAEDRASLRDVFAALEGSYARVTGEFKTSLPEKVRVEIYPDLKLYHRRTFGESAPDWAVGNFDPVDKTLRMVSTNHPGPAHSRKSVLKIAVHEFVHCVILHFRGGSRDGLPNWLDEGTAEYFSNGFSKSERKAVFKAVSSGRLPSLAELERDFVKSDGHTFSYTIVDFIVARFGRDALLALLKDPAACQAALSMTKAEFEAAWQRRLTEEFKPLDLKAAQSLLEKQRKPF
ncbi:MAG: hypothetical protein PHF00_09320 [Elusimicrobia bacterium]|nr:hypothetical protein [Elusimicrobiota bacterium]